MPWQVAASSGLLAHHVLTAVLTLRQRFASRPEVTIGIDPLRQMWSSTARPLLLVAPLLAIAGAWATGWGLEQLGQEGSWRWLGMAAGAVLTLNVVVGPSLSRIRLGRWRSMKQAEADWEPCFAEVFTAKEGAPRIVERTIAPCGAIVDVVDAPPKLMAAGLAERAEMIQAAYGDPSTRIDVLASPNLDAAGEPVAGTAHQLRARIVQWPEGSFPNLLDPDLDDASRDLALEATMARALDAIGINRMVLAEATQVAELPEKIDPRVGELGAKRATRARAQNDKRANDQTEARARLRPRASPRAWTSWTPNASSASPPRSTSSQTTRQRRSHGSRPHWTSPWRRRGPRHWWRPGGGCAAPRRRPWSPRTTHRWRSGRRPGRCPGSPHHPGPAFKPSTPGSLPRPPP